MLHGAKLTTKQGYLFRRTPNHVDKKKKYFVISDGAITETLVHLL